MNKSTIKIHRLMERLGKRLGFITGREISKSLLALKLDGAYKPRVDLMWSMELTKQQKKALSFITGDKLADLTHIPVVAIEIEGTKPSTKILESDFANLAALGAPMGLLVVSEEGEKNIYRRTARVIRSLNRAYGAHSVVPVEAKWLQSLKLGQPKRTSRVLTTQNGKPAGGETLKWSREVRVYLTKMGKKAGFDIAEPFIPQILGIEYDEELRRRGASLFHSGQPGSGFSIKMNNWGDYLTASQIDLAWQLPLPSKFRAFCEAISISDPHLRDHGIFYPEAWDRLNLVGFELESGAGKHAGGGLLNLSSHCVIGASILNAPEGANEQGRVLRTYQPTLGLRNVYVRHLDF